MTGRDFGHCAARIRLFLFAALTVAVPLASSSAQSIEDTFRGKTIRILLPTSAGGGRGLYVLPFAAAYGKHIPGNPSVVPVFMPGAGGSVAMNNAYGAALPDGLTLVSPLKSAVTAQAINDPSVKYDVAKFNWVGRITDATEILFVSSKVPVEKLDDLRTQPIILGSVGHASPTYQIPTFINNVFGTKFKIVSGYESAGAMNMSVEAGETQGAFSTWNDLISYHPDWLRDNKVKVLLQIGLTKNPNLPNVPLLLDLAQNDADRQLAVFMCSASELGESFAAPPGVPAPIVAALRKAFDDTMKDPDFVAQMTSKKIQFNPMNGADLSKLVLDTIHAPSSVITRYKAAASD
jgi:tripartite-type tricarboxylate transporter receptor subunit TctC